MKKLFALALVMIIIACMMAACGEKAEENTESTVVSSTTVDGTTTEQDADGNIIVKDNSGKILSVTDKNGNAIDVDEYVAEQDQVSDPDSNTESTTAKEKTNDLNTQSEEPPVEDEIPTVVVVMPSPDEMDNIPEL